MPIGSRDSGAICPNCRVWRASLVFRLNRRGFTRGEVGPEQPERGFHVLTALVRAHRGHRLGLLLKLGMMERPAEAEPQVRQLFTMNTETNEHMIAINETLGYRVLGKPARSWELPADEVAARR